MVVNEVHEDYPKIIRVIASEPPFGECGNLQLGLSKMIRGLLHAQKPHRGIRIDSISRCFDFSDRFLVLRQR